MNFLVVNCGSSSLNYKIYKTNSDGNLTKGISGKAHRIGTHGQESSFVEHKYQDQNERFDVDLEDHKQAIDNILQYVINQQVRIDAIGHRIVHGGSQFKASTILTPEVIQAFEACLPLAPIHNPNSYDVIKACQIALPDVTQYLSFDTAFHASLEPKVYTYALPADLCKKAGLRKYGFHGLSYQYLSLKVPEILNISSSTLKMVACHLGTGGSSVAAIQGGKSLDTSMGYTPLAGMIMSTRCGDIDPAIPLLLINDYGYKADQLSNIFNYQSGLLGVSEVSSDLRDLIKLIEEKNNQKAELAFNMYSYQLIKFIGAYMALLNGVDALVFTDDVGVQCRSLRKEVCQAFEWAGIDLDESVNNNNVFDVPTIVSTSSSKISVIAMPTDEEHMIALEGLKLIQS